MHLEVYYDARVGQEVVMPRAALSIAVVLISSSLASAQLIDAVRSRRAPVPAFAAAELPSREYSLSRYPKTEEPCVEAARRVAAAFAEATGAKVLKSYCVTDGSDSFALKVVYESQAALRPVTTLSRTSPDAGFGAFESRAACEAALAGESAAFRGATGLAPVAAFCLPGGPSDRRTWSMRLDGFGAPRLSPHSRTLPVFTRPDGMTREQFLGGIKDALVAQGVEARHVAWRPTFGYAELTVSYYGDRRHTLPLDEPVRVDTKEQCREALAEVRPWAAARTPAPLALYCGQSMTGWELAWMFKEAASLKAEAAPDSFKSRADCLKGRAAVAERQRTELGRSVIGAVCSRDPLESDWKAVVFAD